jgi:peptide/nickel transport system permease protein
MAESLLTTEAAAPLAAPRRGSRFRAFWRPFVESRMGPIGVGILAVVALAAILAPVIAPEGPFALGGPRLVPPGTEGYPLGTDHLGRDMLALIVYGARVSLLIGLVAASISLVVGVLVGSVAGYYGGWVDIVLSRLTDMFLIIPAFFLIIVVVATLGSGIVYVMIVIGLTAWPTSARLMRAQALTLRDRTFVQALRALGESSPRILARHIIPNGISPLIANASLDIAAAILIEAGLSFIGLGDPNKATWGRMIFDGRTTITTAWWASVLPGIAIIVTVLGFYLIGDGISYVLNPRSRRVRE